MVHRDLDEYAAARLTLWILAVGLAIWTVLFLAFGAINESAPPLPSRAPAYATAQAPAAAGPVSMQGGPVSMQEQEEMALSHRPV